MDYSKVSINRLRRTLEQNSFFSKMELFKLLLSASVGLFLGVFSSAIVNSTLVEITINGFFAIYFGIIFIVIGVLILLRLNSMTADDKYSSRKPSLLIFSALVIISGMISISLLEHQWYRRFSPISKIPVYVLLGITLNFAIIFGFIDLINYLIGLFQTSYSKTIVESQVQIFWVLVMSVIMGLIYGLIFGLLDVEDSKRFELQPNLVHEEYACLPFAGFLGFIGGLGNEYLRLRGSQHTAFKPVKDPFNEEI